MKIHLLSEQTIDQIAAGEVVENPSSVVKELVENALDAKATAIDVEVRGGGLQLIRVSDDGEGMDRDDAVLSLQRHATSKIVQIDDVLHNLHTMGFRGEALAAIGSVAKFSVQTSTGKEGTQVVMEGGKLISTTPCSRNRGTTIEVRSLFYNVPARKQFQKSASANLSLIHKNIASLSLTYPEVAFRLFDGEKEIFSAPLHSKGEIVQLLKQRMIDVFGETIDKHYLQVDLSKGPYHVFGAIGNPQECRHNRSGQYLILNRRIVRCLPLSFAMQDGYGTRIPTGRFPSFILHFTMPPELLDVNVHPQKKEVRLKNEGELKQFFKQAVMQAFHADMPAEITISAPVFTREEVPVFAPNEEMFEGVCLREEEKKEAHFALPKEHLEAIGLYASYLLVTAPVLNDYLAALGIDREFAGIAIIDLHAAKKRIAFNQAKSVKEPTAIQQLMIPQTIELNRLDAKRLERHLEEVRKIGLEIRPFGDHTFIVEGISPFLEEGKIQELLLQVIEKEDPSFEQLATIACNFIPNPKGLTMQEGCRIAESLLCSAVPFFCPHGKPTMIEIKDEQIENFFTANR